MLEMIADKPGAYDIPIANWAKELYLIRVQDEKGNFYTEKFWKE